MDFLKIKTKLVLIYSKGFQIEHLYIPPFQVDEGDFVVINIFGGAHFYDTSMAIVKILENEKQNEQIEVYQAFQYAQHIKTKNRFFPITIGKFLKKNNLIGNRFERIFFKEYPYLKRQTKINSLQGNPRRLLSVMNTLSKTNKIVFDLAGVSPNGANLISDFIKKEIGNEGTAILIDWADDDLKSMRTQYIKAQIVD